MVNKNVQTEIDTAYLYARLASQEKDPTIAKIFSQMSEIETEHAMSFLK